MPGTGQPLDDGGSAFPVVTGGRTGPGMTLREWFAGQALAGLCASRQGWQVGRLVEMAYKLADEMIKVGKGRVA